MKTCLAHRQRLSVSRVISIPLPTHRLASFALRALSVDAELSPLVRRSFSLAVLNTPEVDEREDVTDATGVQASTTDIERLTVLRTEYRATTNRMLRVAVNGFMESVGVVLGVMQELDVDVLA